MTNTSHEDDRLSEEQLNFFWADRLIFMNHELQRQKLLYPKGGDEIQTEMGTLVFKDGAWELI